MCQRCLLKQSMIISSDSDKYMQEMKIKPRETMNISKFVTVVTRQLRTNKAAFLAAETLGGFAEYQDDKKWSGQSPGSIPGTERSSPI